jgi:hypothetical protein
MWEWTLNWNQVRDDLFIGSGPLTLSDFDQLLSATDATAFLSLQSDACRAHFSVCYEDHKEYAKAQGFSLVNVPMLDFNDDDQRRLLPRAVRSLYDLLYVGHRVYVYCTAGINRSPLTVLGFLTFIEQQSAASALGSIRAARADADPSLSAYAGCRQDLIDALRDHIAVRAYYVAEEKPDQPPETNWWVAEQDVLRGAFVNAKIFPCSRLDPSRET